MRQYQKGNISGGVVAISLLGAALVVCLGLIIWLYIQYSDQKSNVDARVEVATAKAIRDTQEDEQEKFLEREKEPNRQFVGPDDYGRLTFSYPKTWSVYVGTDNTKGGNYEAYLHPVTVPSTDATNSRYALRVVIENKDYDKVVATYDSLVKKGDLKNATVSASGHRGVRLNGSFSKDIRGSGVFFKLRDKTISVFTDANTFTPDFNKIIKTIEFND